MWNGTTLMMSLRRWPGYIDLLNLYCVHEALSFRGWWHPLPRDTHSWGGQHDSMWNVCNGKNYSYSLPKSRPNSPIIHFSESMYRYNVGIKKGKPCLVQVPSAIKFTEYHWTNNCLCLVSQTCFKAKISRDDVNGSELLEGRARL